MKKFLSFLMVMVLAVSMMVPFPITINAEAVTSGTTGDCTWSLDGTVLTISGNGAMGDHSLTCPPWDCFYTEVFITNAIIEEGVTSIGGLAFGGCTALTSITIPDSVTDIGEAAFYECTGLTSITIPDSVTSIGERAFEGCTGLTSMKIPDGVTSIEEATFWGCSGLNSIIIPDGVTSVGPYAFYNCTGLTSIAIPDSVADLGCSAFENCSGLTSITIPDGITTLYSYTFSGCTGLTSITIPDSVTCIWDTAFFGCDNLESMTLPFVGTNLDGSGPTHLGSIFGGAHSYSYNSSYVPSSLKTVVITKATTIDDYAFFECAGLTSVIISESVTSIGDSAFYGCSGLTSVTIPYTVTSVGTDAFDDSATLMVHEDSAGHTYVLNNSNPYELTEHTPAGEDVIVSATCTANGSITNHCTVCDRDYIKVLPLLGHSFENGICSKCSYVDMTLGIAHAVRLLKHIDGHDVELTDEEADINGDGKVTVFDAVRFLQILNSTPIE